MARSAIPTFQAPAPQIDADRSYASGDAFAAPGLAAQRLGGAIERLGESVNQLAVRRAEQYGLDHWAEATTTWQDALQTGIEERRQSGAYQGFAAELRGRMDEDLRTRIENAPDAVVAARLKRRFSILQTQIGQRAATFEHGMELADAQAKLAGGLDGLTKTAYRDPSLAAENFAQGSVAIDDAARSGNLNPEQTRKLKAAFGASLWGGLIKQDPAAYAGRFKAGEFDQFLDARTIEQLTPLVQNAEARGAGSAEFGRQLGSAGGGGATGSNWEIANNNFGGLRKPGVIAGPSQGGFQSFATPEAGVQAIESQLERYYQGKTTGTPLTTLRQIVSTWAPPNENPTETLIARAARVTGFAPDQPLVWDAPTRARLIEATIRNEQGGRLPVDPAIIAKVAGAAPPAKAGDAGAAAPSLDVGIANIQRRVAGGELTAQQGDTAIAQFSREHHQWQQATRQERTALAGEIDNGIALLAAGRDWTPDAAAMRRLLSPELIAKAEARIAEARDTGNATGRVEWATPDELAAEAARVAALPDSDFAAKTRQAAALDRAIATRTKLLADDPAAYAARAPAVAVEIAAANAGGDQADPAAATQAAVAASLAEQERLGVAPEKRRVLTKPQAAEMLRQLRTIDPAQADMGAALAQRAQVYGDFWPQVFGDLVEAGLPASYKIFAGMTEDAQTGARADMQDALRFIALPHGAAKLKEAAGHENVQQISDTALDTAMAEFKATTFYNGPGGTELFDQARDAVKTLAYWYAAHGIAGDKALAKAYRGVIGLKYDFNGTWRAPKGLSGPVEAAADHLRSQVTPEELGPIPGNEALTAEQRQGIYARAIRRGFWVPNRADDGLV